MPTTYAAPKIYNAVPRLGIPAQFHQTNFS